MNTIFTISYTLCINLFYVFQVRPVGCTAVWCVRRALQGVFGTNQKDVIPIAL